MALYASHFSNKIKTSNYFNTDEVFSVIVKERRKNEVVTDEIDPNSIIAASKPFIYFTSFCGHQMARCNKHTIKVNNICSKLYCSVIIAVIVTLIAYVKPVSWQDTRTDIPLNVLTQAYGMMHNVEVFYSIVCITFLNSQNYIHLLKTYNDIDKHLRGYRMSFWKMRIKSVIFIVLPIMQVAGTLTLRKFRIANIGVHFTIFMLMLQGSIIYFLITNFYQRLKSFNKILVNKVLKSDEHDKENVSKGCCSCFKIFSNKIGDSNAQNDKQNFCWYELMQIYDKMADCLHIFNKIYSSQVFFMFSSWFLCTILSICRSLSPSLKYSEIFISDMFVYSCINFRPFFLAVMCEFIVKQWKVTHKMLSHVLIHDELDEGYLKQVRRMLGLIETRKPEISANVYPVNIPTVMHFSGRAISYAVLMIQYFYIHVLHDLNSSQQYSMAVHSQIVHNQTG